MRFTLLCASTALAASLVLSACSGGAGSSSSIPSGGSGVSSMAKHHHGIGLKAANLHADSRGPCDATPFPNGCYALNYGSGPYDYWYACTTYSCPPTYDIVASSNITHWKTGAPVGHGQIASQQWYPSPGNPTYDYITPGRHYSAHPKARFKNSENVYLYYYPSVTASGTYGIY